jgi:predicted RNA-binding protein with PIN domain
MPYLIDGHNLIPKIPGLSLKSMDDEIQLIQVLQDFCRQTGKNVEVYFDNAPVGQVQSRRYGRVKANFVRAGRSADEAILARVRSLGREAKNWHVVSSDREVIAGARSYQAQVISSDEFAGRLLADSLHEHSDKGGEAEPSLNPAEIDEWLRIFGNGEKDK